MRIPAENILSSAEKDIRGRQKMESISTRLKRFLKNCGVIGLLELKLLNEQVFVIHG